MPRKFGTSFAYLRDSKKFPVACLAIQTTEGSREAKVQFAVYNPHDLFDRKKAREIATGRLVKHPYTVALPSEDCHLSFIIDQFVASLKTNNKHLPSRLAEAVEVHVPYVPKSLVSAEAAI